MGAVAGYAGKGDAKLVDRSLHLLRHRGPGGAAKRTTPPWALGARSDKGEQARVAEAAGGTAVVLDGQIYNAGALADDLVKRGVRVDVRDEAAVVAAGLETLGTDFLARLDGPFALGARLRDGSLVVARDALGEKSLYHTTVGDTLLFASEIKAFLAHPRFRPRPALESLTKLLVFSFVPGRESMFEGVYELQPGTFLLARPGKPVEEHTYWDLSEEVGHGTEAHFVERIRTLVRAAVVKRLGGRKKVAATLSGGIDSSAVVAVLRELGVEVTTFSAGFGHGQPNELMYSRLVAQHTGAAQRVIHVEPNDFLDLLPGIMWNLDDPLCDCITVPNYILAREAAKDFDVVFNGEGGDPLFGGPKNKFLILGEWYAFLGGYDRARAYLGSYHKFYDYLDDLLTPAFVKKTGGAGPLEELVRPYLENPDVKHFLNRLMHLNIKLKGGQNILVKVDKMLSANGVRPASPLFDKELTELTFAIPPGLKRKGDIEKYVFKKAVEPILPRAVVYRKKAGMGVPLNHWFKFTKLRDYTLDVITSKKAKERGTFSAKFVEDLAEGRGPARRIGQNRMGELLWMLLAVEIWHRVFIDGDWRPE